MNVLAGIIIGFLSDSWGIAIKYSFIWSIIHIIYGYIFGLHRNPVTLATKEGNPIPSYFLARFTTSIITSAFFGSITFFLIRFFSA